MAIIRAFEPKTKFGELLDRVIAGEEMIMTRHEKPLARLIAEGQQSRPDIQRAAECLIALRKEITTLASGNKPVSWKQFKSFVEERHR